MTDRKSKISRDIKAAFGACKGLFVSAGLFSLGVNLLFLAAPLYMLQVYDRVMGSGSVQTLVMLTIIVLGALAVFAALDNVRSLVLIRMGARIDDRLSARLFASQVKRGASPGRHGRGQTLRDLDNVRQFIASQGIHALYDAPWVPLYIAILALLHPLLGVAAVVGAVWLFLLAIANDLATKPLLKASNDEVMRTYAFTEASLRNAEVIHGMGMLDALLGRWNKTRGEALGQQVRASDRGAFWAAAIKFSRMAMQSGILGLAAWLALKGEVSPGVIFASSMLLARALAPVEQVVGAWRQLVGVRQAFSRVNDMLNAHPQEKPRMSLPAPEGRLSADRVVFTFPKADRPLIKGVGLELEPGEAMGLIGPSAAGKSTLARLLTGIWTPTSGAVRLDGADIAGWERSEIGQHIGYLPQDIELFAGTVGENIARFTDAAPEDIVKAARMAEVHDMILRLPQGYDTEIGDDGATLSGGQRQRIGLARAVFGDPRLVILDEPNSNLDNEGDAALRHLLDRLKERGTTVILISHRPSVMAAVDKLCMLRDGAVELFGPRDDVMARLGMRGPGLRVAQPA